MRSCCPRSLGRRLLEVSANAAVTWQGRRKGGVRCYGLIGYPRSPPSGLKHATSTPGQGPGTINPATVPVRSARYRELRGTPWQAPGVGIQVAELVFDAQGSADHRGRRRLARRRPEVLAACAGGILPGPRRGAVPRRPRESVMSIKTIHLTNQFICRGGTSHEFRA